MPNNTYTTRIIFTSYVCDRLIEMGEEFLHIRQDLKHPEKNVFVFNNSDTFTKNMQIAIEEQIALRK